MKVYKYIEKRLNENYIDIHYKEMNQELAGILEYLDYYNTLVGENKQGKIISINEIFYYFRSNPSFSFTLLSN